MLIPFSISSLDDVAVITLFILIAAVAAYEFWRLYR
jgi:hypothetical protein